MAKGEAKMRANLSLLAYESKEMVKRIASDDRAANDEEQFMLRIAQVALDNASRIDAIERAASK